MCVCEFKSTWLFSRTRVQAFVFVRVCVGLFVMGEEGGVGCNKYPPSVPSFHTSQLSLRYEAEKEKSESRLPWKMGQWIKPYPQGSPLQRLQHGMALTHLLIMLQLLFI